MDPSRRIGDQTPGTRPLRMAAALRRQMGIGHFAAGEVLVRQGEPVRTLYVVTSGTVRVLLGTGEDAREVASLGRGSWIGEMALLTRSGSSTTVEAETDVRVLMIGHREFIEAAEADPSIYREIARELAERLHSADDLIEGAAVRRVVGLEFAARHAAQSAAVLDALGQWTSGAHIVIHLDQTARADTDIRQYADSAGVLRLRNRIALEGAVSVASHSASADAMAALLRASSDIAPLVVLAGQRVPEAQIGRASCRERV